jgi:hypothetical protein
MTWVAAAMAVGEKSQFPPALEELSRAVYLESPPATSFMNAPCPVGPDPDRAGAVAPRTR